MKNSLINEQINIFLRHSDEFTYSNNDVDLNNHFDIFFAIYSQVLTIFFCCFYSVTKSKTKTKLYFKVLGTEHEQTFLCLLRHLLRIDNSNKISNVIWEVIEKLVCRATLLEDENNIVIGGNALERYTDEKFKNLLNDLNKEMQNQPIPPTPPPPPPPPLPTFLKIPPPPPPFLSYIQNDTNSTNIINKSDTITQKTTTTSTTISSNNFNTNSTNLSLNQTESDENIVLPQQCVPKANSKMKQLIWSKIHPNRILGRQNLWTKFKNRYEEQISTESDKNSAYFQEIEEYFKTSENPRAESQCKDPNLRENKIWNSSEKVKSKILN